MYIDIHIHTQSDKESERLIEQSTNSSISFLVFDFFFCHKAVCRPIFLSLVLDNFAMFFNDYIAHSHLFDQAN